MNCLALVLGTLLAASAMASNETPLLKKISPFQEWSKLGAQSEGLLVSDVVQNIGQLDHMRLTPQQGQKPLYRFTINESSPVVIYFPSKGEGENFMKNWSADGKYFSDVAMYSPATPNLFGLKDDAHIVDVEVNNGNGSEPTVHFIATKVNVLPVDGTLNSSQLLNSFLAPYSRRTTLSYKNAQLLLELALDDALNSNPAFSSVAGKKGSPKIWTAFTASWLPQKQALKFNFYMQREFAYTVTRQHTRPHCTPSRITTFFGSEYALTTTIDSSRKSTTTDELNAYIMPPRSEPGLCHPVDPIRHPHNQAVLPK